MSLFDPSKGMLGNIESALIKILHTDNRISIEQSNREQSDTENREAVEQSPTDLYLDGVQAQQDITDIQLQLLEG